MKLFLIPLISFLYIAFSNAENKECPIMLGDEIDEEEVAEFEGKKVYFCCTACVKIWNKNPKYIIKAMPKLLPQFSGMDEKLGLDKVELLDQRMCPVYNDRLVTPDSPTVEVEGKTVYLYNKSALRRFNKSPERYLEKALEGGLLPQLPGNKAKKG